jgi:hypothetical protein
MKHLRKYSAAVLESRRIRIDDDLYARLGQLADRLWRARGRGFNGVTQVDSVRFRTLDGTEAMMRIYLDPAMEDYWGTTDTDPLYSRDPMDLVMTICHPRHFSTKRDLLNVLVHETIHAMDPGGTTRLNIRDQAGYKWWSGADDSEYLSHRGEYMTIYSEVLDALVRTMDSMRRTHSARTRLALLDDLLGFFRAGGPGRAQVPDSVDRLFYKMARDRDLLGMIGDIRRHAPGAHRLFLSKLHSTAEEIRSSISNQSRPGA